MKWNPYPKYKESGVEWLGDVPSHWEMRRSRRLFALRTERAREIDRQLTASQKHGILLQEDFARIEGQKVMEVIKGADILKHVEPGDFVISMRSFEGGLEYSRISGSISSAYVALIPSRAAVHSFFGRLFKSDRYIQALQSTTNLVRDGQALRFSNFTQVDLPLPPATEQAAIATFVDRETAKIDTLIAKQERLIELLQEKRQALISHAVTKGLNPDAPMKPSGVEWLGDVPAHWEVGPLKMFVRRVPGAIKTGPFGSQLVSEDMQEGEIKVYNQRNVIDADFTSGENYIGPAKFSQLSSFETFPGDLLVTTRGTIGRAEILPANAERGILHPCLLRVQVNPLRLNVCFLQFLVRDSHLLRVQLDLASNATTIEVIYSETMANLLVVVPPLPEQAGILKFLTYELDRIDAMAAKVQTAIALMRERRIALISAAVTGKIDVREVQ